MQSSLADTLQVYFEAHGVRNPSRADSILALLRINTAEALQRAQELAGIAITVCPPAVPPWPPKPISSARSEPRIRRVGKNPCLSTTGAHERFSRIRVGMTREELRQRGVTARDLRRWVAAGSLEVR